MQTGRWLIPAALLMAVAGAGRDASAACLPLTPQPSDSYIIPGARQFVYASPPGHEPLLLDAFAQPDGDVHPAVLVVHGGGWNSGSRVAYIGQFLELLTEAGYQWVAVDYRLGAQQDAQSDVREALSFVRCHATALRIDPERIVVLGEDVGAQLAIQSTTAVGVRGVALVGGVYAPAQHLPGVPALVVHGSADSESPLAHAREFCDRITAAAGACAVDVVDGGIHRAENWRPSQWAYKPRLVTWLRRVIGEGAARPLTFTPQPVRDRVGPGLHKRLIYSPGRGMTLDAWIPPGAGPFVPVLLVHGGGWEAGDRVTYITPMFAPLADARLAWFSMDYGLTPEANNEQQLRDVGDAIAFLRRHSGIFNIDARKLVIVGESASGQLVAQIGAEDPGLAGVVSFYGVYDFLAMAANLTPRSAVTRLFGITALDDQARATLRKYSPLHAAHKDQPPLMLVTGTADGLWAQAQAMVARLQAIGARHHVLALEGAPHGMENWEGNPQWLHYKARVVEWIQAVTAASR